MITDTASLASPTQSSNLEITSTTKAAVMCDAEDPCSITTAYERHPLLRLHVRLHGSLPHSYTVFFSMLGSRFLSSNQHVRWECSTKWALLRRSGSASTGARGVLTDLHPLDPSCLQNTLEKPGYSALFRAVFLCSHRSAASIWVTAADAERGLLPRSRT